MKSTRTWAAKRRDKSGRNCAGWAVATGLCITHLPQVAAQGQSHFAVEKRVKQNRTLTELTRLEGVPRQRELARMLAARPKRRWRWPGVCSLRRRNSLLSLKP